MSKGGLTDLKLRALTRAQQPSAVADGGGLTFTASKAGTTAWVLRYRFGGKQREISLGRWPDMSLAMAREEAAKLRVRVMQGEDVAATKRATKIEAREALTVEALAEDYLRVAATYLRASSLKQRRRLLEKEALPFIGKLRADKLPSAEIVKLVERTAERSHSTAEIVLVALRMLYAHARAKRLLDSDPTAGLKFSAIVGERQRRRVRHILSREELKLFVEQLFHAGEENSLALRLVLLTGVRKNELQRSKWSEVDLEKALWVIPPENAKKGRGFTIPLPAQAVSCFRRLKEMAGNLDLVLPQHYGRSRGQPTSPGRLNYALTLLDGFGNFTPHDLRATMRSYLGELGISVVVAERCLNHALGGLVEVYDRGDYLDARRAALQQWADFLDSLSRGANVVPIRKTA